ncbi:MAG: hypothetical protein OIF50_11200 [Flavobacteriaceae bacterium]|nr:hypothetical protein [Flavobacteriaceae bacterium]
MKAEALEYRESVAMKKRELKVGAYSNTPTAHTIVHNQYKYTYAL